MATSIAQDVPVQYTPGTDTAELARQRFEQMKAQQVREMARTDAAARKEVERRSRVDRQKRSSSRQTPFIIRTKYRPPQHHGNRHRDVEFAAPPVPPARDRASQNQWDLPDIEAELTPSRATRLPAPETTPSVPDLVPPTRLARAPAAVAVAKPMPQDERSVIESGSPSPIQDPFADRSNRFLPPSEMRSLRQEDDNQLPPPDELPRDLPDGEPFDRGVFKSDPIVPTPTDRQDIENGFDDVEQPNDRDAGMDGGTDSEQDGFRQNDPTNVDDEFDDRRKPADDRDSDQDDELNSDFNDDFDRDLTKRKRDKRTSDEKSCEEFRNELLGQRITDIDLNISPYGPVTKGVPDSVFGTHRAWSDKYGNVLATGAMVKLRHGYVHVDSGNGIVRVPVARLGEVDLADISTNWKLPEKCTLGVYPYTERCWTPQTFTWKASALCHKPLYFEDIQLERYGHSAGPIRQPIRSTAHFFVNLLTWSYEMGYRSPTECQYALGYYRPGDCAPWLVDPMPISLRGAARQAATTTAGGFLFFP